MRLPPALALYPDARVAEAAGTDAKACALRVVSFASNAPVGRLIDWYYSNARPAGFSSTHKANDRLDMLTGTRGPVSYALLVRRQGDGSGVDLLVNAPR